MYIVREREIEIEKHKTNPGIHVYAESAILIFSPVDRAAFNPKHCCMIVMVIVYHTGVELKPKTNHFCHNGYLNCVTLSHTRWTTPSLSLDETCKKYLV